MITIPELPEVEVLRRDLEKEIVGRKIKEVEIRTTRNAMRVIRRHTRRKEFEDALTGAKITGVDRQGKYLLIFLDTKKIWIVHLGMSGQLLLTKASAEVENHTHIIVSFTIGGHLRFIDPRTFGEMFVTGVDEEGRIEGLTKLGIDPIDDALTWQFFSSTLASKQTKLKALLMDQKFICGIGNIYSDEILFSAGLRFDRGSDSLAAAEVRRLYRAIQDVLQEAIKFRGTSADDEQYIDLYGNLGDFQNQLKVYQREGIACRRCRNLVTKTRWSNRSTYFCERCQV